MLMMMPGRRVAQLLLALKHCLKLDPIKLFKRQVSRTSFVLERRDKFVETVVKVWVTLVSQEEGMLGQLSRAASERCIVI